MLDPCFGRIALKLGVIICAGVKIVRMFSLDKVFTTIKLIISFACVSLQGLEFIGILSCCHSLYWVLGNYCARRSWCAQQIENC